MLQEVSNTWLMVGALSRFLRPTRTTSTKFVSCAGSKSDPEALPLPSTDGCAWHSGLTPSWATTKTDSFAGAVSSEGQGS